jgi:DNA-binding transcriptional MerR regulator/effector-binding domain-containing protein
MKLIDRPLIPDYSKPCGNHTVKGAFMKNQKHFTAGEFAQLCLTTKETLRHYNDIGILRPETTGANGYRYYSSAQFFDFYLISSLKRAGSPLSDIRRYLEHPDAEDFLQLLYKQRESLMREKQMVERMERLVRQSISSIELALSAERFGQPGLAACGEEYFAAVEAPRIQGTSELDFFGCLQDHVRYCTANDIGAEFQIGAIVLKDALLAGSYQPSFFCSRLLRKRDCDRLFVKPEGNYVSMLYKGGIETSPAYRQIMEYIAENGLTVCGNAYEDELSGYLSTGDGRNYICRISVQVEGS